MIIDPDPAEVQAVNQPRTRGDCLRGPRPCPHGTCRHHHVPPSGDAVCVLDIVAERGPMTLQEVSEILGVTRERVRQIEVKALLKLKKRPQVTVLGRDLEVLPPPPPPVRRGRAVPRPGGCIVPGCDRPARAKGLCSAHYQSVLRSRAPGARERELPVSGARAAL
jgi:hypothetical protein